MHMHQYRKHKHMHQYRKASAPSCTDTNDDITVIEFGKTVHCNLCEQDCIPCYISRYNTSRMCLLHPKSWHACSTQALSYCRHAFLTTPWQCSLSGTPHDPGLDHQLYHTHAHTLNLNTHTHAPMHTHAHSLNLSTPTTPWRYSWSGPPPRPWPLHSWPGPRCHGCLRWRRC